MKHQQVSQPLVNCWRQCCPTRRDVLVQLQAARAWTFSHYSVIQSGSDYWLSCARLTTSPSYYDLTHELRLHYSEWAQCIAVVHQHRAISVVLWHQHQLIASLTLSDSETEQQWLIEQLKGWTQTWEMSETAVFKVVEQESVLSSFLMELGQTAHWLPGQLPSLPQRLTAMRPLTERLPWQRRKHWWGALIISLFSLGLASWWLWPQAPVSAPLVQAKNYEIAGIALSELKQLFAYQRQANLIAGWQFHEATLHEGEWSITMRPTYGTLSELEQQTPLAVTSDGQTVRLQTHFSATHIVTPQQLRSDQEQAQAQLESLLAEWHEQVTWQSNDLSTTTALQWRDYTLEWLPSAAGMDSKLLAVLQQLPGRLIHYHWAETTQILELTIRFYWLPRLEKTEV